jgi:hypothetical protein
MGDYSFVRTSDGHVCGILIKNPNDMLSDADATGAMKYLKLQTLAIKHQLPEEVFSAILNGNFRLVSNTVDNNGGKFLMFGSYPAPGEKSVSNQEKPWYKFW